jgi:hypothetical protein
MAGIALGIAHAGLAETAVRRLRAMLLMALAEGSLEARWHIGDPAEAHVLVTTAAALRELKPTLPLSSTRVIAVLAAEADAPAPGVFRLAVPIRLEALLELLTMAERRGSAQPIAPIASDHPLMRVAMLIRSDGKTADDRVWRVAGLARVPIYVMPSRRQFYCTESLLAMQHLDPNSEISVISLIPTKLPAGRTQPKPLVMLQWTVGLLA